MLTSENEDIKRRMHVTEAKVALMYAELCKANPISTINPTYIDPYKRENAWDDDAFSGLTTPARSGAPGRTKAARQLLAQLQEDPRLLAMKMSRSHPRVRPRTLRADRLGCELPEHLVQELVRVGHRSRVLAYRRDEVLHDQETLVGDLD